MISTAPFRNTPTHEYVVPRSCLIRSLKADDELDKCKEKQSWLRKSTYYSDGCADVRIVVIVVVIGEHFQKQANE